MAPATAAAAADSRRRPSRTAQVETDKLLLELEKCRLSVAYFIDTYCSIYDPNARGRKWRPFTLWPAQVEVLKTAVRERRLVILKARQLGLSWLFVAYALWLMLFRPGSIIMLFSRTDTEAVELLGRLRGMIDELPRFLQPTTTANNDHKLELANGSRAQSFATTKHSGRSFTATFVLIDEADFMQWLRELLNAAEPTVDAGGQLVLISTPDKDKPASRFKSIYTAAQDGRSPYRAVFLPWSARPTRTAQWYKEKRQHAEQTSTLDDLFQEYPANTAEALAARTTSKRFMPAWISQCYQEAEQLPQPAEAPAIPGLIIYEKPRPLATYLIVADPAEGNERSDPSPITIISIDRWEEAAHLHGRHEPATLARYARQLQRYYSTPSGPALIVIERNNHGHSVILAIRQAAADADEPHHLYVSPFDNKPGYLTNSKNKIAAVDATAEALADGSLTIHTPETAQELSNLEAATLAAPQGQHDDRAMNIIIATAALKWPSKTIEPAIGLMAETINSGRRRSRRRRTTP